MIGVMNVQASSGDSRPSLPSVWIIQHDESPHATVLGVFGSLAEADEFSAEIRGQFPRGVIYSEYPIGYRFDAGVGVD
jgi:hypothetical protein